MIGRLDTLGPLYDAKSASKLEFIVLTFLKLMLV